MKNQEQTQSENSQSTQKKGKGLNTSSDGGNTILEHIDMFKQPIVDLRDNGRKSIPSSTGGIFTLLTVLIFSGCMLLKISSVTSSGQVEQPRAEITSSRRLADKVNSTYTTLTQGSTFNSTKNFKWIETTQVSQESQNLTKPINPFDISLNKIQIIFNHGDNREQIEKDMYNNGDKTKRALDRDQIKSDFAENHYEAAKYLVFQLKTYSSDPKVETVVKDYKSSKYLYQADGDDNFSIFPKIDIKSGISMMGNYFSTDYKMPKTWSEFEIKINWLKVHMKAYDKTKEYFNTNVNLPGYSIKYQDCPDSPSQSYFQMKKSALLKAYSDSHNTFDHDHKVKLNELSKQIDKMLKKMRVGYYQEDTTDAREFYTQELIPQLGKCFTATYWTSKTDKTLITEPYTSFEDYYVKKIPYVVGKIKDSVTNEGGDWNQQLMDSIVVKIDQDETSLRGWGNETQRVGGQKPMFVSQDKLNWDCVSEAAKYDYDPKTSTKKCMVKKNIFSFKLHTHFVQEMFAVPRYENFIAPEINLNVTLAQFDSVKSETRQQKVRQPPSTGQIPDTPFDTLWSAVFTLDTSINKHKEIWIVQDSLENRTSLGLPRENKTTIVDNKTRRLLGSSGPQGSADVSTDKIIEIIAWGAGLWIFLFFILMKPIVNHINSKNQHNRSLGNHIFQNEINVDPTDVVVQEE